MARIKLSPIITSINGKLGNAVFQGGKSGIVLRTKVVPRNNNTSSQVKARSRLLNVKTIWQQLSTAQRDTWISFTNFFQKKSKFNNTKLLTPYELFMQYNVIRSQGNLSVLEETLFSTFVVVEFVMSFDISNPAILLANIEAVGLELTEYIALYISAPYKQSSNIAKSKVRFVKIDFNDFIGEDITVLYNDLFKRLPDVGDKILIKTIAFGSESGWLTKPTFTEYIFS